MKKAKYILCIVLSLIMAFGCIGFSAAAEENEEVTLTPECVTVKMINYNVAGLPKFDGSDGEGNTASIAKYISENNFDIVAVQEDFAYHNSLISNLNGYTYQSNFSGNIPGGDGLNIFTKKYANL